MSNLAKLKKKAAEFEQRKQFDKALGAYQDVLRAQEGSEDADVSLHNRVGDLQMRLGQGAEALRSYERAVDLYAERGFLNNAIALCNKILRQTPSAAHIHYKLGRVNALKGFRSDARQHFLTYAELMQRGGRLDEAFTALKEFADLSSGQEDLRLLLADQFARHDRRDEALAQLQIVLDRFEAERRHAEAQIVRERMRALDPEYVSLHEAHGDETFDSLHAPAGARASGPSAMPELVLIDPTEYGSRSSGGSPRPDQEPNRQAPADDPAGPALGRPSGAVSMPEGLIRGADAELAADAKDAEDALAAADALAAEPYRVADLQTTAPTGGPPAAPVAALDDLMSTQASGYEDESPASHAAGHQPVAGASDFGIISPLDGMSDASHPGAELHASGTAFGDDDLLLPARPGADDSSPAEPTMRSGASSELIDTAALGAALDAVWTDPGEVSPEQAEALADGSDSSGQELSFVMPESPAGADEPGDNPIAGFDSWLASPKSLGGAPASPAPSASIDEAAPEPTAAGSPTAEKPAPMQAAAVPVELRPAAPPPAAAAPAAGAEFINLGDLLREEELPRSTRMVVEERAPSGDEEADFAAMLRKFKQGVAENVDDEDYDSHYDLGVAYKEMGLTEEAIAEFQRALRGTERRARSYEALGQCFLDLGQAAVATTLLQRATQESGMDDQQLVGVLYLLGRAAELLNQPADAVRFYERVLAVDITFSDVSDRIGALEQVTR